MEEQRPMLSVPANIFNKQSRTADKGRSSSLGLDDVLTTPHRKNVPCYETSTKKASGWDRSFGEELGCEGMD